MNESDRSIELRNFAEKAMTSMFALEEFLGPLGSSNRQAIYKLRVELGFVVHCIQKEIANECPT